MEYTQEQFEKLPKWAKDKIKTLESHTLSIEKRLSEFEGKSETNTTIREGLDHIPLPKNAVVEFKTGKHNMNNVSVYCRHDGNIDVNTDSRLGHTMVIMPRAANSFYIAFIER